jgi:hypothetical protein
VTIRKGEQWGCPATRPTALRVATSDRELAEWVGDDRSGAYGVAAGDLHHAVGGGPPREQSQRLPIDALVVTVAGSEYIAVAHVVARRSWWHGRIVAVVNAGYIGKWNVCPRAHPNDGRFDVVEVRPSMSLRQRLQAHRRLRHGTHLPHPDIDTRTDTRAAWQFPEPTPIELDGHSIGRHRELTVTISPDHFAIYV